MGRVWLPIRDRMMPGQAKVPYPYPQNEREELLNRLYKTNTMIPGSRAMEIEELRDRVQAQEDKIRQGHYDKVAPSNQSTVTPEQVRQARGALKEYADWRRKKQQAAGLRG